MTSHEHQLVKDAIYEALESLLEAQLRAIRRLRSSKKDIKDTSISKKSMSQVDMAYDILNKVGAPLHINEIIHHIKITYRIDADRESLVSAISKKVIRGDRFTRVGKNTFVAKKT